MKNVLVIIRSVVTILVFLGAFILLLSKKDKGRDMFSPKVIKKQVNVVLGDYFSKVRDAYKKDKLHNFYSIQFDLNDYNGGYKFDSELHQTLSKLDIRSEDELRNSKKYIMDTLGKIVYDELSESIDLEEHDVVYLKSVLDQYYKIQGNLDALDEIKDKSNNIDKWNKYSHGANQAKKDYIRDKLLSELSVY